MSCDFTERKLPDHVAGRLTSEEAHRVDAHLAACAECREYRERIEHIYAIEDFASPSPPRDLRVKLRDPRPWAPIAAVAAGLVLALVVIFGRDGDDGDDGPGGSPEGTMTVSEDRLLAIPDSLGFLPVTYPKSGWHHSESEAQAASNLSGKPVLRVWHDPAARRSKQALSSLRKKDAFEYLAGRFVCLLIAVTAEPPLELLVHEDAGKIRKQLPASQICCVEGTTRVIWGFTGWDDFATVVRAWETLAIGSRVKPVPVDRFREMAWQLERARECARARRYAEAAGHLGSVIADENRWRTCLIPAARQQKADLLETLERQKAELKNLEKKGTCGCEEANELRRILKPLVGDLTCLE